MINAYGNPKIAAKYEEEIGRMMVQAERKEGHKGILPSSPKPEEHNKTLVTIREQRKIDRELRRVLRGQDWMTSGQIRKLMSGEGFPVSQCALEAAMRRFRHDGVISIQKISSWVHYKMVV